MVAAAKARAAESEPAATDAPDVAAMLHQMLGMLQDVRASNSAMDEKLIALETRIEATEARTPSVRSMHPEADLDAVRTARSKTANESESMGTRESLTLGPNGRPLREDIAYAYQPRFRNGDVVVINPDAVRRGMPDGMTWAERLKKYRSDGLAKIMKIVRLEKYDSDSDGIRDGFPTVEYRYRVFCKNVTSWQGIDIDEHELLAS